MNLLVALMIDEIRLSIKDKQFWLMVFLAVISIFITNLNLLIIQLITVNALTRDQRYNFSGIVASVSFPIIQLYLARSMAQLILLLGLWPFMILSVGFLPGWEFAGWFFNGENQSILLVKYIVICLTSIGFVYLVGQLISFKWQLYLVVGTIWIFGTILATNISYFPSWSELFLFGYTIMRLNTPSAITGYFPKQELILAFALFQTMLGGMFLFIAIILQLIKRNEPVCQTKNLVFLLIMIIIGSFGVTTAISKLNQREQGYRDGLRDQVIQAKKTINLITPTLKSYNLGIQLRTGSHYLNGSATLNLDISSPSFLNSWENNAPRTIDFTLRNYFKISDIRELKNNRMLKWRRSGSQLTVYVPADLCQNKNISLKIIYHGKVWEYFSGALSRPQGPVNFIHSSFSLLRDGSAWYPIPGIHSLYIYKKIQKPWLRTPETILWANRAVHPAVPFDLTVDIDSQATVVTNLEPKKVKLLAGEFQKRYYFRSIQGRDIYLLAGTYHHQKESFPDQKGFIDVYSYRQHHQQFMKITNELIKPYLFFREFLIPTVETKSNPAKNKVSKNSILVEMPPFSFLSDNFVSDNIALPNCIAISEELFETVKWRMSSISEMQQNKRDLAVIQYWWQENITGTQVFYHGNIPEGIILFLFTLYREKVYQPGFYQQIKENLSTGKAVDSGYSLLPSLTGGPVVRDVFLILDAINNSKQGDEKIKTVLQQLYYIYQSKKQINATDFTEVIHRVSADIDCSVSKKKAIHHWVKAISKNIDIIENEELRAVFPISLFTFRPEEWLP